MIKLYFEAVVLLLGILSYFVVFPIFISGTTEMMAIAILFTLLVFLPFLYYMIKSIISDIIKHYKMKENKDNA
jgi:4-amino-4-deoxy-L-arabinose transferase-like glycosyltransferase